MTEQKVLSESELREVGERALSFQRYIFRRTWGVYYAIWSAAFIIYILSGLLPLGGSWILYAILFTVIGWGAGMATWWIFRLAQRTMLLRIAVNGKRQKKKGMVFLYRLWPVALTVLACFSFAYLHTQAFIILYLMLSSVVLYLYYGFKASFGEKTPFECKIALFSFGISIILSVIASSIFGHSNLTAVIWSAESAVWMYCALYALWHAPRELVELRL